MSKKHVFVTGAGRGIGRTIALKLVQDGFIVSGCARTKAELEETKKLSENRLRTSEIDTTNFPQVKQWLESELKQSGATPWGMVFSAGTYGAIGPFVEANFEEWQRGIDINLAAPAYAAQQFARILIANKVFGRILLLSGGGATQPLPNFSNYCATKSGVVRFAETLAHELKPHHIAVNTLAPGAIATKFVDDVIAAGPEKAGKLMYEKALKQKQDPGQSPDNAADLASYLMREDTGVVTGCLISAVWDPWQSMHEKWSEIQKTDWYTMKRSAPPA